MKKTYSNRKKNIHSPNGTTKNLKQKRVRYGNKNKYENTMKINNFFRLYKSETNPELAKVVELKYFNTLK